MSATDAHRDIVNSIVDEIAPDLIYEFFSECEGAVEGMCGCDDTMCVTGVTGDVLRIWFVDGQYRVRHACEKFERVYDRLSLLLEYLGDKTDECPPGDPAGCARALELWRCDGGNASLWQLLQSSFDSPRRMSLPACIKNLANIKQMEDALRAASAVTWRADDSRADDAVSAPLVAAAATANQLKVVADWTARMYANYMQFAKHGAGTAHDKNASEDRDWPFAAHPRHVKTNLLERKRARDQRADASRDRPAKRSKRSSRREPRA